MTLPETAHLAATLGAVLVVALLGRLAARAARQPEVIGEIAAGLLVGPVAVAVLGPDRFDRVLPAQVLSALRLVAEVGLVLFLVGLAHESGRGGGTPGRRQIGWVAAGGFLPSLVLGALYGGWVLLSGDPGLRGGAPAGALAVFAAVALSISAVPVLARITADRGIGHTPYGRLALAAAVVMDVGGWRVLSIAVSLATGSPDRLLRTLAVLTGGVLAAAAIRRLLAVPAAGGLAARRPRRTGVLLVAVALTASLGAERLGLSAVFGAVVVGVAVPAEWARVVTAVSRAGRALVPAFFVVTGVTVLTAAFDSPPWPAIVLAVALGVAGKIGGGWLGARLAGEPPASAARIGVLLNTRGLTELIALQVGYRAHILTGPLYLAFIVMALSTTALTGPLLTLLDRTARRERVHHHDRTARSASPSPLGTPAD
jgi:Kef-type K+ transport system membrane component KefB